MPASSFSQFLSLRVADAKINQVLERLKLIFAGIFAKEILDGQLITSIQLEASATVRVAHKLGRKYNGWFVVKVDGFAQVFDNNANTETDNYIYISSDAAVIVDIWVF